MQGKASSAKSGGKGKTADSGGMKGGYLTVTRDPASRPRDGSWPQPEVIRDLGQIFVIYKPPYWKCELPVKDSVRPSESDKKAGQKESKLLLDWIRAHLKEIDVELFDEDNNPALSGTGFGPLCHRIDQETSGLLLVAKTTVAQRHVKNQFHKIEVSKRYLCLVHGRVPTTEGTVTIGIRTVRTDYTTRSEVSSAGDWAETSYQVVARYSAKDRPGDGYSLIACDIASGRTHQIRVHMQHLGHALVSDDKYQSVEQVAEDRTWCPRLLSYACA